MAHEEESSRKECIEEHEEKPLPEKEEVVSHDSEIEIRVNKKKALAFLLLGILFYSLASSFETHFPFFDDTLTISSEKTSVEAKMGSDLSLPFFIENKSLFEKDVNLRTESLWFSEICSGKKCFRGGNLIIKRRSKIPLTLNVKVPSHAQDGDIRIYAEDGEAVSLLFQVKVLSHEDLFLAIKDTFQTKEGRRIVVTIRNEGTRLSRVGLTLQSVSPGWKTALSEEKVELDTDEEKEIFVDASSGENVPFSAVLSAKTEDGFSTSMLLAADPSGIYDFHVSSEPRHMIAREGTSVEFILKNTGNVSDTYAIALASYPSDWSINLSEKELSIDAGEQRRIPLFIIPASERNTTILLNVTSKHNRVSKNITLNLLPQNASQPYVLAEHFTATWCFVCPIAERAIERLAQENPSLILLNYHLKDAITTSGSDRRAQGLYGMGLNVSTVIFNGTKMVPFLSGGEDVMYERYLKFFRELISSPQSFQVNLSGYIEGDKATINAAIRPLLKRNYEVYFVVYRDPFRYKNSSRRYIVRDVLGPEKGGNGIEVNLTKSFTIPKDDLGNSGLGGLGVVVILQDPVTKTVWQVAVYRLG